MKFGIIPLLLGLIGPAASAVAATNESVWNCPLPLDGNFAGYATCMENAAEAAVENAVEAVHNSPFMAQLPAEQAMLTMARDGGLNDLAQCLNEAGIQFGTVVGNAVSNPGNLVQNRLDVLMNDALANSSSRVGAALSRISSGNMQVLEQGNINDAIDEAYELMLEVAATDPVASCALPMISNQTNLIKQVAGQAYRQLDQQARTMMTTVLQPAIDSGSSALMGSMLQQLQANASSQEASPRRRTELAVRSQSRLSRDSRALAKSRTSASSRTTTKSSSSRTSASTSRTASNSTASRTTVARKAPGTRAGGTFMSESGQIAAAALQSVVGAAVPDDVQRVALAEFTARTLNPVVLAEATSELNALSTALANGSVTNVDLRNLDKLMDMVTMTNQALYTEVGLATIKFYGHETIDLAGEKIITYAVGTLAGLEAALDNAVGAVCSVASIPSGVPCSIIKGIVSFLYQQLLIPTINLAATAKIHMDWEMMTDCGAQAVRAGLNPSSSSGNARVCGGMAPALMWFPATSEQVVAYVAPYLDDMQTNLMAYQAAVQNLATVARNTGAN